LPETTAATIVSTSSPSAAATRKHLEQDHAERIQIRAMIDGLGGEQLFGRHVLGRAHDHASPR